MKKRLSNNPVSGSRVERSGIHSVKPADSFFRKPAGVFLICLLFFGLTLWAFVPALKADFQYFDENGELLRNAHANTGFGWQNLRWALFSMEYSNWYPLTWISHIQDFKMYGDNPWGHHLTSVLLHAANGVLLFLVLKRMTGVLWRSLIVAVLFALHPLRVESVAWISERKDVLSAFFGLLALWTYARYAEESKIQGGRIKLFYGLTLLFFVCGLMSKSMLVTFPCILLLLDYWPLERWRLKSKWRLALEKAPFFLLVVPVSIAAYFAQKAGGQFMLHFPLSFRLETALMGYARYLGKMFWPTNFSVLYPYPDFWPVSQLLFAAVLIFGVSVLAFGLRRQRPYLLVGWLWFLGTLVPVIGLIPLGVQSMSNRYTYIPMIGIVLLTVWAVNDLSKQWRRQSVLIVVGVTLMMGACILRTRGEIAYWKNGVTLWSRAVTVTKDNFMAHYCLGTVLLKTDLDKAVSELQASVAIYPDYFDSELVLGNYLMCSGHFADALAPFERAAQLQPRNSWAHHNLGLTLFQLNRMGDAIPSLLKAVQVDPQNASYMNDLGFILFSGDRETDAISNFLATVRSDPVGFDRLIDAMQFDTNYVAIINNMALSFATNPDPALRNGKYAVRLAARACEMSGFKAVNFVQTLAAAYAEDSRFDEAISTEQLACSLASAAGQTDALRNGQSLLELFRAHKPFHAGVEAIFHQPN
jgi:tetratricopeptide (TPR) repeat protein